MKLKIENGKLKIINGLSSTIIVAISIIIVIAIFSFSCYRNNVFSEKNTPYHYNELSAIYNAMAHNADSALLMINDFTNNVDLKKLKNSEFYEYHILLAEAKYKCNHKFVNELEINEAVHYLDSLTKSHPKDHELLLLNSRANYYRGTMEEEKENYKNAFTSYLDALRLLERINSIYSNKTDILHFKAMTYVRLGDIFYWINAYDAAIECLNNANSLFYQIDNLYSATRNHILMAIIYEHRYNYKNSFRHLSIADSLLMEYNKNSQLKHVIERINASLMYNIGYQDESFKIIMQQYRTLESPHLKMEAAGVLGDMYYSKGMLDSALYYYEEYFHDNRFSIIDAANHIVEISLQTSNNEMIAKYGPILLEETNKELMFSKIKIDISSLYEQYKIEIKNEKMYKSILTYLGIIFFITLLFFFLGLYLLRLKKIAYNREIIKKDFYINSLQDKIYKKSSENKHIKEKISNLEGELNYIKTKRYLAHAPFDLKLKDLIESSPLCQHLVDISQDESIRTNSHYPDLIISESTKEELIDLFNDKFDNAFNKIINEHEGLKHNDNLYFCLYLLGMSEKHISAVTGKTYNTIYNRTKRIQDILGSDENIRETLRNIII